LRAAAGEHVMTAVDMSAGPTIPRGPRTPEAAFDIEFSDDVLPLDKPKPKP